MKIHKFVTNIWNGLLGESADLIVAHLDDYPALVKGKLLKIKFSVADLTARLRDAICQQKVKSRLDELDNNCDTSYTALAGMARNLRKIARRNPNVAYAGAVETVMEVLLRYRYRRRRDYKSQSYYTESFIAALAEPEVARAMSLMPTLMDAYDMLVADQRAFLTEMKEYNNRWNARPEAATSIARRLLRVLNTQLIPYLNAAVAVDEEHYGDLALSVATLVSDANRLVYRHSKDYKEKSEEEMVEEPEAQDE